MNKLKMQTANKADENFKKLVEMFPNAVTETIDENGEVVRAIDKDVLMQEISCKVVEGREERYQFTWPDKKKSVLLANAPISKTLRPIKEDETIPSGADSMGNPYCSTGSVDFDTTENLYIEGDNLEVLKLLQETYLHKVKMIYIDPPYNTGNNLIYRNDFHKNTNEYLANSGQIDVEGNSLVQNPETNGRYHTDWLNMIYPRLRLAKDLLTSDGVIVVAIDENEIDTLSLVLKDVFGEVKYEHTCVTVVHNPRGQQGKNFSHTNEYALFVYPIGDKVIVDRKIADEAVSWSQLRNWGSESERTDAKNCFYPILVKDGKIIDFGKVSDDDYHPNQTVFENAVAYVYPIDRNGVERKWRYARQTVESIKDMLRARKTDTGYEIEIGKTFGVQRTVWSDTRYDANEYGTKIISELVPNNGFTFPKSLWTVYDCLYAGVGKDKNAIVLDFFSGSGTTAQAIMQLNLDDGGHRKFIMAQVPEKTEEKSVSYNAGYKNICEIGKERIRRAGAQILREATKETAEIAEYGESYEVDKLVHKYSGLDVGFRVLKCDTSNMKEVFYRPDEVEQTSLNNYTDNIKEDRTPEDLLFQVMLDLGVLLSSKIEETTINGCKVYNVAEGFLYACFDNNISDDVVKAIAKEQPYYAVFRDSGMVSDSVMTNFDQIFASISPSTVRKVL